jgi:hypothetical protein
MPLLVKVEITHYNEMNNKNFDIDIDIDIDMNVSDNVRIVIESISFHPFHGQSNWLAYIWWGCISLIDSYCSVAAVRRPLRALIGFASKN